jgi:hypothetical protein
MTTSRSDRGLLQAALAADDRRRRLEVESQPADGETKIQAHFRSAMTEHRLERFQKRKRGRP